MLWASMLTAFYGFLRISEYTTTRISAFEPGLTLRYQDVAITSASTIKITLQSSKTDPFSNGAIISLHKNNSILCPISAITNYLQIHPSRSGPFFTWQDGRYLTRRGFSTILNRIKPNNIANMSSHSFRIGAATTAAAAGYPRWLIQALGRWSSNCYKDYIRIPHNTLSDVSMSLSSTFTSTATFDPDNISSSTS